GGSLDAGLDTLLIGRGAGGPLSSGSENIFMGFDAGGPSGSSANSSFGVAIGSNAISAEANGVALGSGARVPVGATNSVAIGAGTVATNPGTIILGDPLAPLNVGIGTNAPTARLSVEKGAGETG
ncbi:unnamed protein product, partial [Chrysoparadoxa australica]